MLEAIAGTLAPWKRLPHERRERLDQVAARLLGRIDVEAARGFDVTDAMIATIIGHAALLAVGRHDRTFHGVRAVVVHPRTITLDGERPGPIPETVVAGPEPVAGHTSQHGPVFIDWGALRREAPHPEHGRNVAFHEFAHKLDAENGDIDGIPAVGRGHVDQWRTVCDAEYRALRNGRGTVLLDHYAASDPGEFFAVTTELFFTRPVALALDRPDLYAVFRDYFAQDPAEEWTEVG
jgi:hypothetical protein